MKKQQLHNPKYYFKLLLIVIFTMSQLMLSLTDIYSQTTNEYTLKSVFVLRVANFVDWPENSKVNDPDEDFVIAIFGEDPFDGLLEAAIKSRKLKIKNKNVVVKRITKTSEINHSDILFISSSEKYNLSKIIDYTKKLPILTIGDTKGYVERGVMVNMFIDDVYLNLSFDVNMNYVKLANIYISSKLLVNAVRVIK